jgi:hypothetical protein
MALYGKGWFIWQIARCEKGHPAAIAEEAVAAGLSHVLIKVAERTFRFGFNRQGQDLVAPVVAALHERGIQAWGWHYVYGDRPADEARTAIERTRQLGLDGYVIDAEGEYRRADKAPAARTLMSVLRAGLPGDLPVALSTYRYPSLHRALPWAAFLERCDLAMPQMYWEQAHNPETQLARCVAEYRNPALVGAVRPIVPTGSAYGSGNWRASPREVGRFLDRAQSLGLTGANLYSWDYATTPPNTELWEAAAGYTWPAPPAGTPDRDLVPQLFTALNRGDAEHAATLYRPDAGHVTPERTIVGQPAVQRWYVELLRMRLPGARFKLLDLQAFANSRRFHWTAASPRGQVLDGDDTLGLVDGRIQYHFASFTISPPAPPGAG